MQLDFSKIYNKFVAITKRHDMWRTKLTIIPFTLLFTLNSYGQAKDSSVPEFKVSGYMDAYYARYTDNIGVGKYQQFADVAPKNNELGLNIVQLTGQYNGTNARAVVTLHYGDLPSSAWSPTYNMIQEANAGVKLGKKVWLDAGFFKTHIGTEALLPKDNITSTIAVITLFEPWFQSGFKLSYAPNDKYIFCLHVLNGYNTFVDNNSKKSFGISAVYSFGDKGSLGYYNLIGDEMPDSLKTSHMRFLNNLVLNYQITPKLKTIIGVDYIGQQNSGIKDPTAMANIYSALVTLKYQLKPKFACYGRFELYNDEDNLLSGVVLGTNNMQTGYKLTGYTLGFEEKFTENSYLRFEARDLVMDQGQKIFTTDGAATNTRAEGVFTFGVWF